MLSIHVSCAGVCPLTLGYFFDANIISAQVILGHTLYSLAYPTNYLYLVLIGCNVNSFAFSGSMYNKKHCSNACIVGIRR